VDNVSGGEAKARSDFALACGATVQGAAMSQQFRPGSAVNGPVDPAAAQKGAVGGIDDGVDGQRRNIGANGAQCGRHSDIESVKRLLSRKTPSTRRATLPQPFSLTTEE
jgi:hypothetical protein